MRMPAVKRSHSETDSLQSLTPPSSPTGPTTPFTKRETAPDVASTDDEDAEHYKPIRRQKSKSGSKSTPATPKSKKVRSNAQEVRDYGEDGVMTPEKKEGIIADVIAAGLKTITHEELATKYGLTKAQIKNAMQAGRANLREKIIKAARNC